MRSSPFTGFSNLITNKFSKFKLYYRIVQPILSLYGANSKITIIVDLTSWILLTSSGLVVSKESEVGVTKSSARIAVAEVKQEKFNVDT